MTYLKRLIFIVLAVVVFFVALLAAVDNSDEVSLKFLGYESWVWPISWWMLAAFVGGVLFGTLLNLVSNTRLRMNVRQANRAAEGRTRELDQLKATQDSG